MHSLLPGPELSWDWLTSLKAVVCLKDHTVSVHFIWFPSSPVFTCLSFTCTCVYCIYIRKTNSHSPLAPEGWSSKGTKNSVFLMRKSLNLAFLNRHEIYSKTSTDFFTQPIFYPMWNQIFNQTLHYSKKDGKMRTAVSTSIKVFGAGWPQYVSESDI